MGFSIRYHLSLKFRSTALVATIFGVIANFCSAAWADVQPKLIPSERENNVRTAFAEAAQQARVCTALAEKTPWLRERMIEAFDHAKITIELLPTDKSVLDECAHSNPSWVFSTHKMFIRPAAFHPTCRSLASVIFHEMIHMTWTYTAQPGHLGWGSEEEVRDLEYACIRDPLAPGLLSQASGSQP